jgi:3-methylcrotonyl-CoA carboxylase alpha subunit
MVTLPILADGAAMAAQVRYQSTGPVVTVDGVAAALDAVAIEAADAVHVLRNGRQTVVRRASTAAPDQGDGGGPICAPMHGKVLALLVADGDKVEKGQRLAIIEAMKMEHTLTAPRAGRVGAIVVAVGNQVAEGASLMTVEAVEE